MRTADVSRTKSFKARAPDPALRFFLWSLVHFGHGWVVQYLLSCLCQFLRLLLFGLEQERKLLQCLSVRFWEEEVNEYNFEAQPTDIDDKIFPISILKTDRINKTSFLGISACSFTVAEDLPNMTADRPKSWNHDSPLVRT